MELNYIHGARITAEIKKGKAVHEQMEQETNVPIVLMPKSYPDFLYKDLYIGNAALDNLFTNKKTREIKLYGSLNGFRFSGKIDQLDIKGDEVVITEDKTKASDNLPSEPQLLTHKVQVMLYRKMLDDLSKSLYTSTNFKRAYRTTLMKLTPEFIRQLDALNVEKDLQSIDIIADKFFGAFTKINKISNNLHIRYTNQYTGKEIKLYKFDYNEKEMQDIITFVLKYWNGERESLPVPEDEKWKCNYCVFFGKECRVWWPQKGL